EPYQLAIECEDQTKSSITQLPRIRRYCFEHGLHIPLGLTDYAQDVTRGSLLLKALLQLSEQPRVLDRDHRLIGKGLKHGDLSFREHCGFCTVDIDRSDWATVAKHRDRNDAHVTNPSALVLQAIFLILPGIAYVGDGPGENGAARRAGQVRRHRKGP